MGLEAFPNVSDNAKAVSATSINFLLFDMIVSSGYLL